MYAVIITYNFDPETKCYLIEDYDKAKAYLHWLWEEAYNEEIAENTCLNDDLCFHTEEDYAQIEWMNQDREEFILTLVSELPEKFETVDWKRYL